VRTCTSIDSSNFAPLDDLGRLIHVVRVEIGELALGDLAQLRLRDRAHLGAVGLARTLGDAQRLADQHGGGRRLGDERERAVLVHGDHHRDHGAGFGLRLGVERLAELHDVDPVLAQRGAHRRRRAGLAGERLQLDRGEDLLGH